MEYMVRLSSDITIKSDRVRAQFLGRLYRNITFHLAPPRLCGPIRVEKKWNRIYVRGQDPNLPMLLTEVFGVHDVKPILARFPFDLCQLELEAVRIFGPLAAGKSFAVRVRRSGTSGFKSPDLERALGFRLYQEISSTGARVNLKDPDITLAIEVREGEVFLLGPELSGSKGLPIGTSGRAVALVSGGFDSLAAAWLAHKRGLCLDFVFFKLAPMSEVESLLVANLEAFHHRWSTGSRSRFALVDLQGIVQEIYEKVPPDQAQVVLKRVFYRGARFYAQLWGASGIVTGESLGQVSTQTLENLATIENVLHEGQDQGPRPLVLRPLLTAEKDDIIALTRRIGTFERSKMVPELCQISKSRPATRLPLWKAEASERALNLGQLHDLMAKTQVFWVGKGNLAQMIHRSHLAGVDQILNDEILVDIREEEEFKEWHLPKSVNIPWYYLEKPDPPLKREASYVLYCQMGLLSALLAQSLTHRGYNVRSLKVDSFGSKRKAQPPRGRASITEKINLGEKTEVFPEKGPSPFV